MTTAYPLVWPVGFPRTKEKAKSRIQTSISGAIKNITDQMRLFGNDSGVTVQHVIVSSNVTLMDQRPKDTGIACYFVWDKVQCCIAVDRYTKVEENLQAIALIVEAERTKLRHGGLNIVKAAFRGYASLPPPLDANGALEPPWWDTLGLPQGATLAQARAKYTDAVKTAHPDRGGDPATFNRIVNAWKQAQEALQHV